MSIPFWIFPASAWLFPNTAASSIIIMSGKATTKTTEKGSRRNSRNSVRVIAR